MKHFTPVKIAPLQAHNGNFCAGKIGCNGHILLIAMTNGLNGLTVFPGIHGIGVTEQQNKIDLVIGDAGIDLLMTALLVRKQQRNGQTGIIRNQPTGSGCSKQIVLDKDALVGSTKLDHQFFFLIMRQKCNVHCGPSFLSIAHL